MATLLNKSKPVDAAGSFDNLLFLFFFVSCLKYHFTAEPETKMKVFPLPDKRRSKAKKNVESKSGNLDAANDFTQDADLDTSKLASESNTTEVSKLSLEIVLIS